MPPEETVSAYRTPDLERVQQAHLEERMVRVREREARNRTYLVTVGKVAVNTLVWLLFLCISAEALGQIVREVSCRPLRSSAFHVRRVSGAQLQRMVELSYGSGYLSGYRDGRTGTVLIEAHPKEPESP